MFESNLKILKNKSVKKKLTRYLSNGISSDRAISFYELDLFIDCSLSFFFKYLSASPDEEPYYIQKDNYFEKDVINSVVEKFYADILIKKERKNIIKRDDIKKKLKKLNKILESEYLKNIKKYKQVYSDIEKIAENQNSLRIKLFKIFQEDIDYSPFELVHCSSTNNFMSEINIEYDNKKNNVFLKSNIFRIDKKDNEYRIIRYETKEIDIDLFNISDLFDYNIKSRNRKLFHVLFNLYIFYHSNNNKEENLRYTILELSERNGNNIKKPIKLYKDNNKINIFGEVLNEYLTDFEKNLKKILSKLFSEKHSFHQSSKKEICEPCNYSKLCAIK